MKHRDPRAAVCRRLVRALRRATRQLAALDLVATTDPDAARCFGPGLSALRRELSSMLADLDRDRTRNRDGRDA